MLAEAQMKKLIWLMVAGVCTAPAHTQQQEAKCILTHICGHADVHILYTSVSHYVSRIRIHAIFTIQAILQAFYS